MSLSILVIGAENPRIRDLFSEVGRCATVSYLNIGPTAAHQLALSGPLADSGREKIFSQFGKPDVIVFTWPQLAYFAEKFRDITRIYYCKDPFEHWACWNRGEIHQLESRLLDNCDAVFAVSRLLVEDFRPRTPGKVFYLSNGVEESFLSAGPLPRPANLPADKPILGSVGQLNATYDWQYIAELASTLPDARLCFIGNISEGDPLWSREIANHLTGAPNILFLDRQPHEQIPAYLQHFDISMCLLRADDYADRRSPLRLYDYLTTERPIISTPIREAFEHLPHIHIAKSAKDAAVLARRILAGEFPVDVAARRQYISQQTWPIRASQFLAELLHLPKLSARPIDFPHQAP
jgi:hypothetical protein